MKENVRIVKSEKVFINEISLEGVKILDKIYLSGV